MNRGESCYKIPCWRQSDMVIESQLSDHIGTKCEKGCTPGIPWFCPKGLRAKPKIIRSDATAAAVDTECDDRLILTVCES